MVNARRNKNNRTPAQRQAASKPSPLPASVIEKEKPVPLDNKNTTVKKISSVTTAEYRSLWNDSFGKLAIRATQSLVVLLALAILIFGMLQLHVIVVPVLIALIIASALHPLVTFMVNKKIPRVVATVIALVSGVAIFSGVVTLIVTGIKSQWGLLEKSVLQGIKQVQEWVIANSSFIDAEQLDAMQKKAVEFATSSSVTSGALAGASNVFSGLASFILGIVILFFFVKDGLKIWAFILKPLPPVFEEKAKKVGARSVQVLGGYVNGTALIALVDSVLIGLGLWILQVPLALPLAVIVFIGAFIPIVGASAAGVLAALVALVTNDLQTAIIVAIIVVIVNQLEGNFLAPVVLGKSLALHELVVLLALATGTILGGIIGTLLSVPIAAVTWAAIKAWQENSTENLDKVKEKPKLIS
jgi:predicted PurR-regulated permease PerM